VTSRRCRFRTRLAALVAVAGLALGTAGCGQRAESKAPQPQLEHAAVPARSPERSPAATAGGACQLLDFYAVEELIGIHFDVAASSVRDATATCVLRHTTTAYPDLTLAITTTSGTAEVFRATAVPAGSTAVDGVGLAAYQIVREPSDASAGGPSVELGWLSRGNRLYLVRYRCGPQAQRSTADDMAKHLVDLAKFLDGS
jgi:hypothetical protein